MSSLVPSAIFGFVLVLSVSACGGSSGDEGSNCELNDWTVSGTFDGQPASGTFTGRGAQGGVGSGPWDQKVFFVHGLLWAFGDVAATEHQSVTGKGLLSAPVSSFLAGAQIFSDGTTVAYGDPFSSKIHLEGLHHVGTCPGTPVTGSLSACFGFGAQSACANPNALSGTLGDKTFSQTSVGLGSIGQSDPAYQRYYADFDDGSTLQLQGDPNFDGILVLSDQSADPGAVYCLEGISVTKNGDDTEISVTQLSRAGALPGSAVSGSLDLSFCSTP